MPATDSGDINASIKLPVGTALATTDATIRQIEKIVRSNPNVGSVLSTIGTTGRGATLVPFQGSFTISLKEKRTKSTPEVINDLRRMVRNISGANVRFTQFDLVSNLMTGGNQNIEVDIFGDDLGQLSASAADVIQRFRGVRGLENLDVNWQDAMPEIQWKVDRQKALQLGVSFSDIANTLNTASNGTITTYYQEKGFQYPIIVQMPEAHRKTVSELQDLVINPSGQSGRAVLLRQVAQPIFAMGPSQITRQDRQRFIAVQGVPQGRSPGDVQNDMQKQMEGVHLPQGFYWAWGTDQKRRGEEFAGLGVSIALAVALIYMLLASQFESFVYPLIVLCSVPLSVTGVLVALFLTNRSMGLTAMIGMLMLVGIVVKNGISAGGLHKCAAEGGVFPARKPC